MEGLHRGGLVGKWFLLFGAQGSEPRGLCLNLNPFCGAETFQTREFKPTAREVFQGTLGDLPQLRRGGEGTGNSFKSTQSS